MLAEALLHFETLDFDDIKTIIEHKRPPSNKFPVSSAIRLASKTAGSAVDVPGKLIMFINAQKALCVKAQTFKVLMKTTHLPRDLKG